jgi:threonine/homoserine/homoserine lactone efflux protein
MSFPPISLFAVVGAAAITPGPNNLIVMTLAARHGLGAVSQALIGVLSGLLLLLVIAHFGLTLVSASEDLVTGAARTFGSLYFAWLGYRLIVAAPGAAESRQALPSSALAIVGLQFVNPKAWLLAMTVAAAAGGAGVFWIAASVTLLISGLCLCIWAFSGMFLARALYAPRARRLFEIAIGATLAISAIMLASEAWSVDP